MQPKRASTRLWDNEYLHDGYCTSIKDSELQRREMTYGSKLKTTKLKRYIFCKKCV